MQWIIIGLFIVGCMFQMAWYGAKEPNQTLTQKRIYGVIAIAIWFVLLVLVNTVL